MDTSQLLLLLPMMTTMMKTSSQDGVSAPGGPRMDSLNMRHVLRWRPLQDNCSTALVYSVQFQGEFELSVLNDSWVDAAGCQRTPGTSCDLTFDLGSDSDYRLRIRAHCGAQTSAWSRSSSPFNRRDTVLTAPLMKVASEGGALRVSLSEPPRLTTLLVEVWRRGEEQATALTLLPEQTLLLVPTLQVGERVLRAGPTPCWEVRRSNGEPHAVCHPSRSQVWVYGKLSPPL
ncbi:unnamed protein product [Tetraodon nigroviridis]|nr:unnamed protein product [Tetraodon nigroviridis]